MTNGNEPTDAGTPDDDATSIVRRPDAPETSAPADDSDATTISQLPATPAPQADQSAGPTPSNPAASNPAPQSVPGQPDSTTVHQAPQFGQTPQAQPQFDPAQQQAQAQPYGAPAYGPGGQPQAGQPQYGAPAYGAAGQPPYGQHPQYPQYPQYPQPGQPQYGQQAPYGQPQYGQQAPYGQPQYGQPQYDQPQYGAPAYGQPGQPQPGQQQFGQQQFGADPTLNPYAPQQPESGEKPGGGKATLIAIIGGAVVAIAAIVLITAFVWPNWAKGGLNQDAVQSGVREILTGAQPDGYGISDVKDVSCPDGQKVEEGTTFTCSVTVNGQNKHVTVTVKDSDGTYEVSRPTN